MSSALPDWQLRPATAADFPAIRALIRAARINPTGLDWRRFVVAVNLQGELIGCAQLKPHGDGSLELASLAVRPADRGRGVAGGLIRHLVGLAPRPLYLMCRAGLGPFYERHGFRAIPPEQMPPYFRRIHRLFHALSPRRLEPLLVMRLE